MSLMAADLNPPLRICISHDSGTLGQNRDSAEHVPDAYPLEFAKRPPQAANRDNP
jgi:hypothetical protein